MTNYRHGESGTRLHNIWRGMLKRVDTMAQGTAAFEKYANRGITVCREWRKYENFRDWARANGYADNLSIERENNDGNYEPGNCSWIPMKDQAKNRRTTRKT